MAKVGPWAHCGGAYSPMMDEKSSLLGTFGGIAGRVLFQVLKAALADATAAWISSTVCGGDQMWRAMTIFWISLVPS
jgi:hypothetical protein